MTRGGVLHARYSYRPEDLQLLNETQQQDSLNVTLTRTYETGGDGTVAGRPNGYAFPGGSATWTFDTGGRPSTVTDGNADGTFSYGYLYAVNGAGNHEGTAIGGTESHLPFRIAGPQVTANLEYDSSRNVLVSRTNTYPNGTLSKFAYTVNAIGQRTALSPSGDAFPEGYPRKTTDWGYNERGELVSSKRDTDTWTYRADSFDAIGNRITATVQNTDTTSYFADQAKTDPGANALNQYGAIAFPTTPTLTIEPLHDADGNLTHGPVAGPSGLIAGSPEATTASVPTPTGADLQWDAENRLIRAEVGEMVVTYAYDHLSRLISRTQGGVTVRYLYDGWNRIAEYQEDGGSHTLLKTYLWGLDLSGSPQGAGGVGGLLRVLDISGTAGYAYPAYDGNGNVSEYVNSSGAQLAHFQYDPFGNLTADTSSNAADFPFRFSTKPQDPVTGLLYYGYRWLNTLTGNWPSRDPIGEKGGANLHGFVRNDGVGWIDFLGLEFGIWTGTGRIIRSADHSTPPPPQPPPPTT